MKKIAWILFFYFTHVQLSWAQPAELNGKIRFAWGDEFNGTTLNPDMWKIQNNMDQYGSGGGVARANNVYLNNGLLNVAVKKEKYSCPDSMKNNDNCYRQAQPGQWNIPYEYTYGAIQSKEKYNQQYGYAEAKLYFNPQPGNWPAFWTFVGDGHPITTMNAGEIDIMERAPDSNDNNEITTNVHLGYCYAGAPSCSQGLGQYCTAFPDCFGRKHHLPGEVWYSTKYAVYWDPNEIVFYADDVIIRTMPNPKIVDPLMFILAMGVSVKDIKPTSTYPTYLYVDFIHVYSLVQCRGGNTTVPIGTVVDKRKMNDTTVSCTLIDGNGTTGGKMTVVAKKTIALLPNFSVKQGGALEARISSTGMKNADDNETKPEQYNHSLRRLGKINTEVTDTEERTPEDIFTISPNPISTIASITYTLSRQANVRIALYNMIGTVEDELVNEHQPAGDHTYSLNGLNYKAGTYLLVFESNGLKQKRTIIITK